LVWSQAITEMLRKAMTYVDAVGEEGRHSFVKSLQTVCEGRIHLEREHALLCQMLARMHENEGDLDQAARIIRLAKVETIGSMELRERVEYILEQMRLTIRNAEYLEAKMLSRKITRSVLSNDSMQDLRLCYYELLIEVHESTDATWEIAQALREMYSTPMISNDKSRREDIIQQMVLFLILSEYSVDQQNMLKTIPQDRKAEELKESLTFVRLFTGDEMIVMKEQFLGNVTASHDAVFKESLRAQRADVLRTRVIQHNIRIAARFFTRLPMERLAFFLSIPNEETEQFISDMVSDNGLHARIDRPVGVVSFEKESDPDDVLNEWSSRIDQALELLEKCTHLISREFAVHDTL
jgi:26S proteasome regulatory subunit N5